VGTRALLAASRALPTLRPLPPRRALRSAGMQVNKAKAPFTER